MRNNFAFALLLLLLAPVAAGAELLTVWTEKPITFNPAWAYPASSFVEIRQGANGSLLATDANQNGLYRSTNGGAEWARVGPSGWYFLTIASNFSGGWIAGVYTGSQYATAVSSDDGINWTAVNYSIYSRYGYAWLGIPGRWAILDGTIPRRTLDNGASWTAATSYPANMQITARYRLAGTPADPGYAIMIPTSGVNSNVFAYTTNYGGTWAASTTGALGTVNLSCAFHGYFLILARTSSNLPILYYRWSSSPTFGGSWNFSELSVTSSHYPFDITGDNASTYHIILGNRIARYYDGVWSWDPSHTQISRTLINYSGGANLTYSTTVSGDLYSLSFLGNYYGPEPPEPPAPEGPRFAPVINATRTGFSGPKSNEILNVQRKVSE